MAGPKEIAWREFLGEDHQTFRDAAFYYLQLFGEPTEEVGHQMMGTPPVDVAVRQTWQGLFADLRHRISSIVSEEEDRHAFHHALLFKAMQKTKHPRQSVALADHFRSLFLSEDDLFTREYLSSWVFPDNHTYQAHWVVFCDTQGPAAVAAMRYGDSRSGTCSLDFLQGMPQNNVDLIEVADRIVSSWEPMVDAGWTPMIHHNEPAKYPVYDALMERYCVSKDTSYPLPASINRVEPYRALDMTKERIRALFDLDGKKDRRRHQEYMFE